MRSSTTNHFHASLIFCRPLPAPPSFAALQVSSISMLRPSPAASAAPPPVAASDGVKVAVRSSCGDGSCMFVVDAPACSTIADVKRLLCCPPHSLRSEWSAVVLVLKGKCTAFIYFLCPTSYAIIGRLHSERRHHACCNCSAEGIGCYRRLARIQQPSCSDAAAVDMCSARFAFGSCPLHSSPDCDRCRGLPCIHFYITCDVSRCCSRVV
jgi:hypothetical protein